MKWLTLALMFILTAISLLSETPHVLWTFDLKDNAFGQACTGDIDSDGKYEIVFSTYRNDGHVYALNAEDGTLLWKFDAGGCADAAPVIVNVDNEGYPEIILHASCTNDMYCLNGNDGSVKWQVKTRGTDSPPSVLRFNDEVLLFDGDFGGYLTRYNPADGSVVWEKLVEAGYFVQTAPVISDVNLDKKYDITVATWNLDSMCNVYAFNYDDGSLIWKSKDKTGSVYHGPSIAPVNEAWSTDPFMNYVLLSDFDGTLHCINGTDGSTAWTYKYPGCGYAASPTLIAQLDFSASTFEILYFCDNNVCLISHDGHLLMRYEMTPGAIAFRGGILTRTSYGDDNDPDIVFGNNLGEVTSINAHDFTLRWKLNMSELYAKSYDMQHGPLSADFNGDGLNEIFIVGGQNFMDIAENYGKAFMISTEGHNAPLYGIDNDENWTMFQKNHERNSVFWQMITGIEDDNISGVMINPNPASDYIEISVGAQGAVPDGLTQVQIFDILGMEITTPSLRDTPPYQGGEIVRIYVSNLQAGVYFVRAGDVVRKFVKM